MMWYLVTFWEYVGVWDSMVLFGKDVVDGIGEIGDRVGLV